MFSVKFSIMESNLLFSVVKKLWVNSICIICINRGYITIISSAAISQISDSLSKISLTFPVFLHRLLPTQCSAAIIMRLWEGFHFVCCKIYLMIYMDQYPHWFTHIYLIAIFTLPDDPISFINWAKEMSCHLAFLRNTIVKFSI